MKTLTDVQTDATTLHALAQGAFELLELTPTPATPAANALYGLLVAMIERADTLARDLGNLSDHAGKPVKVAA